MGNSGKSDDWKPFSPKEPEEPDYTVRYHLGSSENRYHQLLHSPPPIYSLFLQVTNFIKWPDAIPFHPRLDSDSYNLLMQRPSSKPQDFRLDWKLNGTLEVESEESSYNEI